jgi:LysM repeat protein
VIIIQTYTVKAGDTLYGISNQFGVSVTELAELNNIKGSNLQVGQVLNIPSKSGTNPNNLFMYTVVKGDSLYKIAQKYNTTVQAIINLNYLKNTNLSVGQILRIPEMYTPEDQMVMPSYKNYTVKRGDSLYKIALENDISVDQIKKDNSLTSNTLRIGQVLRLRLPASQMVSVEECFGEEYTPPSDNLVTYTVKKGDNLYNIARNYNTSVSEILNLNNLSSANLSIGQQLKIPTSSSTNNTIYVVKKGDNLYDIAKKYNTTVDSIKKKNNLTSNLLQIGQKLTI